MATGNTFYIFLICLAVGVFLWFLLRNFTFYQGEGDEQIFLDAEGNDAGERATELVLEYRNALANKILELILSQYELTPEDANKEFQTQSFMKEDGTSIVSLNLFNGISFVYHINWDIEKINLISNFTLINEKGRQRHFCKHLKFSCGQEGLVPEHKIRKFINKVQRITHTAIIDEDEQDGSKWSSSVDDVLSIANSVKTIKDIVSDPNLKLTDEEIQGWLFKAAMKVYDLKVHNANRMKAGLDAIDESAVLELFTLIHSFILKQYPNEFKNFIISEGGFLDNDDNDD